MKWLWTLLRPPPLLRPPGPHPAWPWLPPCKGSCYSLGCALPWPSESLVPNLSPCSQVVLPASIRPLTCHDPWADGNQGLLQEVLRSANTWAQARIRATSLVARELESPGCGCATPRVICAPGQLVGSALGPPLPGPPCPGAYCHHWPLLY